MERRQLRLGRHGRRIFVPPVWVWGFWSTPVFPSCGLGGGLLRGYESIRLDEQLDAAEQCRRDAVKALRHIRRTFNNSPRAASKSLRVVVDQ